MATENSQPEIQTLPALAEPVLASCRKSVKSEDATFVQYMRARFGDFIHTPMDEHKECLKYTVQKMMNMAKFGGDKKSEAKEDESSVALQPNSAK